jgi:hypothetical protein
MFSVSSSFLPFEISLACAFLLAILPPTALRDNRGFSQILLGKAPDSREKNRFSRDFHGVFASSRLAFFREQALIIVFHCE